MCVRVCVCMLYAFGTLCSELIQKTTYPIAVHWHTEPMVDSPATAYRGDIKVERTSTPCKFSRTLSKSIIQDVSKSKGCMGQWAQWDRECVSAWGKGRERARASEPRGTPKRTHRHGWFVRVYYIHAYIHYNTNMHSVLVQCSVRVCVVRAHESP